MITFCLIKTGLSLCFVESTFWATVYTSKQVKINLFKAFYVIVTFQMPAKLCNSSILNEFFFCNDAASQQKL